MRFAPHMATVFNALGRPAVYTPPAGPAVPCRAIRATKALMYGSIALPVEGACFDILRSQVSPEPGGVFEVDGVSHPVDVPPVPYPADQDPEGLRARLLCGWGMPVLLRSATGARDTLNPPAGSGFQVAANAAAGATVLTVKAGLGLTGQVRPGDRLIVAGQTLTIANTVSAASNAFAGVQVDQPLAAPVAAGDPVSFAWARDFTVRAAVVGYTAEQLAGGVQVGDRRLTIPAAALAAAGMADEPKAKDRATIGTLTADVLVATAAHQAGAPVLWEVTVR